MTGAIKRLSEVFKLRIGAAITLCAVAGMAVTSGSPLTAGQFTVLVLAVFLSAASAGAFNQYAERDLDARMSRTLNRPFATGAYRTGWAWLIGIVAPLVLSVGIAFWVLNAYVALYVFLGAMFYGVVYTLWLKQRSIWNIVIGGLAGSFAVLAGSAAVTPKLAPEAIILAVVLFLWTPPHFWSLAIVLRKDYADAGVPMLPVVIGNAATSWVILGHTVALVAISLLPLAYGMGPIYLAGAVSGGSYFIFHSIKLVREPGPEAAKSNFLASFVQLGSLLLAAIFDSLT
jgi:protoheme IX farnesyltransferase